MPVTYHDMFMAQAGVDDPNGKWLEAFDRINHSIVALARAAIEHITAMGWRQRSISLEIEGDEPLPYWVTLRGKRVFEIRLVPHDDGRIEIEGEWISEPVRRPGLLDRILRR